MIFTFDRQRAQLQQSLCVPEFRSELIPRALFGQETDATLSVMYLIELKHFTASLERQVHRLATAYHAAAAARLGKRATQIIDS